MLPLDGFLTVPPLLDKMSRSQSVRYRETLPAARFFSFPLVRRVFCSYFITFRKTTAFRIPCKIPHFRAFQKAASIANLYKIINALDLPADHILRPEKVCYTPEQEQVMIAVQSCGEQIQEMYVEIGWALVQVSKGEKGTKKTDGY